MRTNWWPSPEERVPTTEHIHSFQSRQMVFNKTLEFQIQGKLRDKIEFSSNLEFV